MLCSHPKVKLDAFFPEVGMLLEQRDYILNTRRNGVEVNVFLPFSSITFDIANGQEIWILRDFLKEGVRIYWDPDWDFVQSVVLVIDDKPAVQLEGGVHYTLQRFSSKFSYANSFNILRGEIQAVQKLHRKPPDFDLIFRVDEHPIFFSSNRLTFLYNVGDIVEVAYLVNVNGFGTRTPFAPAEIFYEGLGIKLLKKANITTPYEPKDLHAIVERLVEDFLPRHADIITNKRIEKWALKVHRAIREKLNKENLFIDAGDESFIYRTIKTVAESTRENFERSYLSRGLVGRLILKFMRYKTMFKDRFLGVP